MSPLKLEFLIKLLVILLIGIFSAFLAANRSDNGKDRNDTEAYAAHYYCIASHKTLDQCRNEIGGSAYEFLYENFVEFLVSKFNFNFFYDIKFAIALVVYSTVLLAVGMQSRNAALSICILLLDFRFWEYGSNVLRHGFAASFIALSSFYLVNKKPKISIATKFLAIFSHLSALIVLITPTRKYSTQSLIIFVCATLLIIATSEHWIAALLLSNFIDYKIDYYLRNTEEYNFSLPIHYSIFMFTGLVCYYKTRSISFIATFNYLVPLFFASIILGYLDASYRMASFMLPILAINIPEQISIAAERFKERAAIIEIFAGILIALMMIIAYRNMDFFLIHLE